MEFKDKIMLYCFKEVSSKQGFCTRIVSFPSTIHLIQAVSWLVGQRSWVDSGGLNTLVPTLCNIYCHTGVSSTTAKNT